MDTALSVIIPAYNAREHVGRSLASLTQQFGDREEIIVVDDGSTDGTSQLVREIAASRSRSRITLRVKENRGVSSARNAGIEEAQGDYILFLDADDSVSPDFAATLLPMLREQAADVIHWPYDLVDEEGKALLLFPYGDAPAIRHGVDTLKAILMDRSTRVWTGSAVYRREFLLAHGIRFTVGCTAGEDIEFIYRALSRADGVAFTGKPRSFYLQHQASVMHRHSVGKLTAVSALERLRDEFLERKDPALAGIAGRLSAFDIPHSYAGTYTMCLRYLMGTEGMDYKAAKERLAKEIEERFPGMAGRMRLLMADRKRGLLPDRLDVFRLSPRLYLLLSNLRQRDA